VAIDMKTVRRSGRPLKLDAERILAAATQATDRLTNVEA